MLDSSHALLSEGACLALGEIGRNGHLPLPAQSKDDKVLTSLSVTNKLLDMVKASKLPAKVGLICQMELLMVYEQHCN